MRPQHYEPAEASSGEGDTCCSEGYSGNHKDAALVSELLEGFYSLLGGFSVGFGRDALGEHFPAGCVDMLQDPGPLGVRVGLFEGFPFVNVVLESFFRFCR